MSKIHEIELRVSTDVKDKKRKLKLKSLNLTVELFKLFYK